MDAIKKKLRKTFSTSSFSFSIPANQIDQAYHFEDVSFCCSNTFFRYPVSETLIPKNQAPIPRKSFGENEKKKFLISLMVSKEFRQLRTERFNWFSAKEDSSTTIHPERMGDRTASTAIHPRIKKSIFFNSLY